MILNKGEGMAGFSDMDIQSMGGGYTGEKCKCTKCDICQESLEAREIYKLMINNLREAKGMNHPHMM